MNVRWIIQNNLISENNLNEIIRKNTPSIKAIPNKVIKEC